ncbi:MAG: hypothetical protein U1F66_08310 [bacterium]
MASPGGGSSGVGGPPRSGMDIVQNMFEANQAKPLENAQQAANLAEQTRTQEQNRETVREGEGQARPEGAPREGEARGSEGSRAREAGGEPVVRESEMDGFLARNSQQQQQRDAGRTLSRPQTISSINVQAWTVANSLNTPETARALIHQRLQQGQAQGANPQAGARATPGNPAGTAARSLPMARSPLGTSERAIPLLITYARAFNAGGETAARAFTGRGFNPEGFLQQVQRLMQQQMGAAAQQLFATGLPVAVQIRGNLVFVKDGKELRAFRLNKDGSLSELPSEDGGEHPLSPEAQSLLGKVLRQRALHARKEGGMMKESEKLLEAEAERLQEGRADSQQASEEASLDFETRFALLLHEVLEEGRDLDQPLGGKDPNFPVKSDWEAFFTRMMKLGNQEKGAKKAMEAVLAMIFRGMFKKEGQGNVMVGDLKYLQGEKTKEEKFAQVAVDDELLLKLLARMKPGQKLSQDQLKAAFGEELDYTALKHLAEQLQLNQAEEFAKKVVFNPKGNIDAFSQARLERSIFGNKKNEKLPLPTPETPTAPLLLADPGPQGVPANVFELLGLKERYRGKPRLYSFVFYLIVLAVLGLSAAAFLMKNL